MGLFLLRRLLLLIPIMLAVSVMSFAIVQLTPGDPVRLALGRFASQEQVETVREAWGLNDPLTTQYFRYLTNALQGDLGQSYRGRADVLDEILRRLPSTAELAFSGMALAFVIGVGMGILTTSVQQPVIRGLLMIPSLVGLSIPVFWLAIILIRIFGVQLGWVSVIGGKGIQDLILPAVCLALGPTSVLTRLTRSSLLEALNQDYVRTAYAKGLTRNMVFRRHVLKNALIPVITVTGVMFANVLTGTLFIEVVFGRPGLGKFAVDAVFLRDFPQIQGIVLFTSFVFVVVNLIVDILYALVDPRIRLST